MGQDLDGLRRRVQTVPPFPPLHTSSLFTLIYLAGEDLFCRLPSSALGASPDSAHNKDAYGNHVVDRN